MNTQEVANKLVNFCKTGNFQEAQETLYAANAVSVEPEGSPNPVTEGMEAIAAKGQQWSNMIEEVHSMEISEPIVAGNHFSLTMKNDVTFKERGRQKMEEVCVYEVKDGKIVREQFFYPLPPQG